jgi:parvulin-like peptidyl-prolyl isomerase
MNGKVKKLCDEVTMAKSKPTKIVSKKHLARQERERRQTRLISGVAIGIVAIVILLIAYGLLNNTLFLYLRRAVTVNGESLTMQEFQARVRVARQGLINQYMQYTELAQAYGIDPTTDPQLSQALNQITSNLDSPSGLGGQVMDDMINDLIIRQYAKTHGIVVTEADIEDAIHGGLGYYPSGTPTPTLTPAELIYPTLNATQLALVSPTPTATLTLTPTFAPSSTPLPTPTPNMTSTATGVPTPLPTATPYTLQGFNTTYQSGLKYYATLGVRKAEYRKIFFEFSLYRTRVTEEVTADVKHEQDQVWIRQILASDETTANDVRTQLLAGADFTTLAAKDSLDTATQDQGGDMGWLGTDALTTQYGADYASAVFALKMGEISQPIQSTYGYHIVQLLGHELRPLTDQEYQDAVTTAFNNWLTAQHTAAKIVINSSWTNYIPTTPTIAQAQAAENATMTVYVATYQAGSTQPPR